MTTGSESTWPEWLPRRLLTVAEVADLLKISRRHVRRLIADGRLHVIRLGRAVRIRPESVAALVVGE